MKPFKVRDRQSPNAAHNAHLSDYFGELFALPTGPILVMKNVDGFI